MKTHSPGQTVRNAFPLRRNALLFAGIWIAFYRLYRQASQVPPKEDADSFRVVLLALLLLSLLLLGAAALLSALPATLAWALARWQRKNSLLTLTVEAATKDTPQVPVHIRVSERYRLFWGSLRVRLLFSDGSQSGEMVLRGPALPASRNAAGETHILELPYVQVYSIAGVSLRFRDALGLVEWPLRLPASALVVKHPERLVQSSASLPPVRTEELKVFVEEMRRTEGDLYSQKVYEAGDDMRRILWQQYARTRELAVRIPNRFEPYASEIAFYVSFAATPFSSLLPGTSDAGSRYLLSHYKSIVWTLFEDLKQGGMRPVVMLAQSPGLPESLLAEDVLSRQIAACTWQYGPSPVPPALHTLCLSSMCSVAQVEQFINSAATPPAILYVTLSRFLAVPQRNNRWKRLFLRPDQDVETANAGMRRISEELQKREQETLSWLQKNAPAVTVL